MSSNSARITLGGRDINLIGTAHVSKESIDEVARAIREEKPDMVCVELDQARFDSMSQKEKWEGLNISKVFREGKGFLLIANLVLAGFQRRLGSELGVKPGEEMKTALDTAAEMGIPYSLCDRELQVTLRRAWAGCGLWSKCKLLASLLASAFTTEKLSAEEIETLKNRSELDGMMSELAEYLPNVKATLIDERDRYLASKIWASADAVNVPSADAPAPKRFIAVIGAGHLQGIKTHLEKLAAGESSASVTDLDIIPARRPISRAAGWLIPVVIIGLIAAGFFMAPNIAVENIKLWILVNGSLAALGALLALGHPLAILVSFLGAPLTSLTPVIGVGILSGLVQATFRKPRVSDTQTIAEDIGSLKGIYRNRISRALLVFFLSSLGSSIGTFVAVPSIVGRLIAQ